MINDVMSNPHLYMCNANNFNLFSICMFAYIILTLNIVEICILHWWLGGDSDNEISGVHGVQLQQSESLACMHDPQK